MKQTKYLFESLLLCLLILSLTGCEQMEDGTYVKPIALYEKVNGNWKLLNVRQIDETAKSANLSPNEIALTDQFNFGSFGISLNVDAAGNPTGYTVSGQAPELFPKQGYWDLDNSFPLTDGTAPKINLYSDAAKTLLTDQLSITSLPGANAEMEFKLTRISNNVPFVSYQFRLMNANQ